MIPAVLLEDESQVFLDEPGNFMLARAFHAAKVGVVPVNPAFILTLLQ
jgi:hypothetical protein